MPANSQARLRICIDHTCYVHKPQTTPRWTSYLTKYNLCLIPLTSSPTYMGWKLDTCISRTASSEYGGMKIAYLTVSFQSCLLSSVLSKLFRLNVNSLCYLTANPSAKRPEWDTTLSSFPYISSSKWKTYNFCRCFQPRLYRTGNCNIRFSY